MSAENSAEEAKASEPKQLHFAILLLLSAALFVAAYAVNEAFRWTDHLQGFANALRHGPFIIMPWLVVVIPWSLLVAGLYKWRKWVKFRTHVVIAPSYMMLALAIVGLVMDPPTAAKRFESRSGIPLPDHVKNLECHFSGGGFIDYTDRYYFETTSAEVDRLIEGMDLKERELYRVNQRYLFMLESLPGCPDYHDWPNARLYERADPAKSSWFYYLITDESRTQVYIMIGCT